jgi:hypothetical protein
VRALDDGHLQLGKALLKVRGGKLARTCTSHY